jgi:hypothetical protein
MLIYYYLIKKNILILRSGISVGTTLKSIYINIKQTQSDAYDKTLIF